MLGALTTGAARILEVPLDIRKLEEELQEQFRVATIAERKKRQEEFEEKERKSKAKDLEMERLRQEMFAECSASMQSHNAAKERRVSYGSPRRIHSMLSQISRRVTLLISLESRASTLLSREIIPIRPMGIIFGRSLPH